MNHSISADQSIDIASDYVLPDNVINDVSLQTLGKIFIHEQYSSYYEKVLDRSFSCPFFKIGDHITTLPLGKLHVEFPQTIHLTIASQMFHDIEQFLTSITSTLVEHARGKIARTYWSANDLASIKTLHSFSKFDEVRMYEQNREQIPIFYVNDFLYNDLHASIDVAANDFCNEIIYLLNEKYPSAMIDVTQAKVLSFLQKHVRKSLDILIHVNTFNSIKEL